MDPNETLRQLRALVNSSNSDDVLQTPREAEIVDLFEVIDAWLSGGGFLPRPWLGAQSAEPKCGCGRGFSMRCPVCDNDE